MHAVKSYPRSGRLLSAMTLALVVPAYAGAATITTTDVTFASGSKSVTDPYTTGAAATTQTNVAAASPTIAQFDSSTGVLTGATVSVSSNRQETLGGSASKAAGTSQAMVTFGGSSTAAISGPGLSSNFASVSETSSCTLGSTNAKTCTLTTQNGANTTNATISVAAANLDAYVGTSTVGITMSVPQLQSNMTVSGGPLNGGSSVYTVNWSGTVGATYSYLLHAAPSFASASLLTNLVLDFGTVGQHTAPTLAFSLFNPAGDRTGVNLTGVTGTGDVGVLGTNLAPFNNLLQGGSSAFSAFFDTRQLGEFNAVYRLGLGDYLPPGAASSTAGTSSLQITLKGAVVPVPAALWLFLSAIGGLATLGLRTR